MAVCMNRRVAIVCSKPMLPIIIHTKKRIFKYYTGFSFFLFIWISDVEKDKPRLIRHEKIHFYQQLELLFIFHWALYGLFYVISRFKRQQHYIAYRYNPFELEAYHNDPQVDYHRRRRLFGWVKYLPEFWKTQHRDMRKKVPSRKDIGW
jgi:hypothetical protein